MKEQTKFKLLFQVILNLFSFLGESVSQSRERVVGYRAVLKRDCLSQALGHLPPFTIVFRRHLRNIEIYMTPSNTFFGISDFLRADRSTG